MVCVSHVQAQSRVLDMIENGFTSSTHVVRGRSSFQLLELLQGRLLGAVEEAYAHPWWLEADAAAPGGNEVAQPSGKQGVLRERLILQIIDVRVLAAVGILLR